MNRLKIKKYFSGSFFIFFLFFVLLITLPSKAHAGEGNSSAAGGSKINKVKDNKEKVIGSGLLNRLEQGEDYVNVIVLLKGYKEFEGKVKADKRSEMATVQTEIRFQQDSVLRQLNPSHFKRKKRFENILGFYGRVNQEGIDALVSMPQVELVEEDKLLEVHLAQGIPLMNASTIRSSYDGTGVSVAVVDTGIDFTHSMLGGGGFPNTKVIGGYDFGDSDIDPMDCQGHGTAVAGISAGTQASGPGDYIGGVAHNAKLYALKIVSGCQNWAYTSTIAAAWDWAVTHRNDDPANPILVINTSFGGGYYTSACDANQPTLAAAADNAVANGITLFGSSGNDGYTNGISSPACVSNSVSVGAVYDADLGARYWSICTDLSTYEDLVTCYSNSASFLDILAPSNNAYTTKVGGGYTSSFGGTSAASPYSAGAAAILQDYAKSTTGFYYTSSELKSALVDNGDPVTDPKNSITKPHVNVGNLTCSQPARIAGGTPVYYPNLQDAYDATLDGDTIESRALVFNEDLYIDLNKTVTLEDGYNCNYTSVTGETTINGTLTISDGKLLIGTFP